MSHFTTVPIPPNPRLRDRRVPQGKLQIVRSPFVYGDRYPWKVWGHHPYLRARYMASAPTFDWAVRLADRIIKLGDI